MVNAADLSDLDDLYQEEFNGNAALLFWTRLRSDSRWQTKPLTANVSLV